jgi:hypothetical protein
MTTDTERLTASLVARPNMRLSVGQAVNYL